MKKALFIMVLILCLSCKIKTVTLEKMSEIDKNSYLKHFDSIVQLSAKLQLKHSKEQSLVNRNWVLQSISELDSIGNRKPLNYKHYIDGKLAEEIYLEGGELSQSKELKQLNESEHKREINAKKGRFESHVSVHAKTEKSTKNKDKKTKINGFQFGFYVWLFLLIVVIIILHWLSNKFKLTDKFKEFFNSKGE